MEESATAAVESIKVTSTVGLVIGSSFLIFFELNRTRNNRMFRSLYRQRSSLRYRKINPKLREINMPKYPRGFLEWAVQAWRIDDEDFLELVGLDGYMMIRFIRLCRRLCWCATLLGCAILTPIYAIGNKDEINKENINFLTMTNLLHGSEMLWSTVFFAWFFALYLLHELHSEHMLYTQLRSDWLSSGDLRSQRQAAYTVMVEHVPPSFRSPVALADFFNTLFPNQVHSVSICLNLNDLSPLVTKRNAAVKKLKQICIKALVNGQDMTKTTASSCLPCMARGTKGKRVLAREYYGAVVAAYNQQLRPQLNSKLEAAALLESIKREHLSKLHEEQDNMALFFSQELGLYDERSANKIKSQRVLKNGSYNVSGSNIDSKIKEDTTCFGTEDFHPVRPSNQQTFIHGFQQHLQWITGDSVHSSLEEAHAVLNKDEARSHYIKHKISRASMNVKKYSNIRQRQFSRATHFSPDYASIPKRKSNSDTTVLRDLNINQKMSSSQTEDRNDSDSAGDYSNSSSIDKNCQSNNHHRAVSKSHDHPVNIHGNGDRERNGALVCDSFFYKIPESFHRNNASECPSISHIQPNQRQKNASTFGLLWSNLDSVNGERGEGLRANKGSSLFRSCSSDNLRKRLVREDILRDQHEAVNIDDELCSSSPSSSNEQSYSNFLKPIASAMRDTGKNMASYAKEFGEGAFKKAQQFGEAVKILTIGSMSATAFITFKSLSARLLAIQAVVVSQPDMFTVTPAPEPRDLIWSNVTRHVSQIRYRQHFINLIVFIGLCFWASIVTGIQAMTSPQKLDKVFPGVKTYVESNDILSQLVTSYLPVLLVLFLLQNLYIIFKFLARRVEGYKSESEVERAVIDRFFYFQLANVYVTVTAGSVLNAVENIIRTPSSVITLLAEALPTVAIYFTNLLITKITTGLTIELCFGGRPLKFFNMLFVESCTNPKLRTPEDRTQGAYAPTDPWYGRCFADFLLVMMIVFVYQCIAPFVALAGLLYFMLATIVYKYQLLHCYCPLYESGGQYFYKLYRQVVIGAVAGLFTLLGYMPMRGGYQQGPFLFPLPFLVLLVGMKWTDEGLYSSRLLSLDKAAVCDREDELAEARGYWTTWESFSETAYQQPEIREAFDQDSVTLSSSLADDSSDVDADGLLGVSKCDKAMEVDKNSDVELGTTKKSNSFSNRFFSGNC